MNHTPPTSRYWRGLSKAPAESGEFSKPWDGPVDRRGFLKMMGATTAMAGLAACTREPIRPIVPYVTRPEEIIPGQPLHYATAMALDGFAIGLVMESHEGHPTKAEGNPSHPASLGATRVFEQASLMDLYNPNRAHAIRNAGQPASFGQFNAALNDALRGPRANRGAGLRILTQSTTSPALIAQLEELLRQFPEARWHQYQPLSRDNTLEGARMVFNQPLETRYHLDRARVIVLLDSDCFFAHPAALVHTRAFARGRMGTSNKPEFNRLYAVEPTPSISGTVADHRLPASSAEIEQIGLALAAAIGLTGANAAPKLPEAHQRWVTAVARELQQNPGASVIIAGEPLEPPLHALVHLMNEKLGNTGRTVEFAESPETHWVNHKESIAQLASDMTAGAVECLVILGGNPVFDAPAELNFRDKLENVRFSAHLASEQNETSAASHWHIPESHFLESWGDARAFDGTASIVQPLIMPLYDSKTAHEILYLITHEQLRDDYDIARDHWKATNKSDDFEKWWRQALYDGLIANTQLPALSIHPRGEFPSVKPIESELEICFRHDPSVWDGRFADNGWLLELPKPISKVTWDNPALISPALAARLNLENGDVVELQWDDLTLSLPIWVTPGQAENSVAVQLGLGRSKVGMTGRGAGNNGYLLRTTKSFWKGGGLKISPLGRRILLASTQHTHSVEGRSILESHEPAPAHDDTLYQPNEFKPTDYAWGMSIDLNTCIGCNACIIACQSENNIPVVGREQVAAGRDMQWIRIDQYFEGKPENPRVHNQPLPCMQCENAPCELVCPVGATVHDHQGLNLQVYNRCVGTRYCSNNCPYKVRRFNFFRYSDYDTPSLQDMRNPNVTVRWRGVMEKCTYCLQRISAARIASELQGRPIRDGEIKTACQQVCPAEAITFGNIRDPNSAVSKLKASPLNFSMLGELNTRPRTTYLKRVGNPNPQLEEPA